MQKDTVTWTNNHFFCGGFVKRGIYRIMQGREILALAGLRVDGRRHNEIRSVRCRLGAASDADGSVYLEQVPFKMRTMNDLIAHITCNSGSYQSDGSRIWST